MWGASGPPPGYPPLPAPRREPVRLIAASKVPGHSRFQTPHRVAKSRVHSGKGKLWWVDQRKPRMCGRFRRIQNYVDVGQPGQPEAVKDRQQLALVLVLTEVHADEVEQRDLDAELLATLSQRGVAGVLPTVAEPARG